MNENDLKEMILVAQSLIENYNDFFKKPNKVIPENIKDTYLNLATSFLNDNEKTKSTELQDLCKTIRHNLEEAETKINFHNQNINDNTIQNEIIYAGVHSNKLEIIKEKIAKLLEKNINRQEILIIPYTNKDVKELNNQINPTNEIKISTINNLVLEIINKSASENTKIQNTNVEGFIKDKLNSLLKEDTYLSKLCKYLIHYHFKRKNDLEFTSDEEKDNYYKLNKPLTFNNELVHNFDEVDIANFLYENQINYKYEDDKFNLTDYNIVIKYQINQVEESNDIICYAKEKLEGKLLTNLYNNLKNHQVAFNPRQANELWNDILSKNPNIIDSIVELYQTIITQLISSNQVLETFNTSLQNKKLIELVSPIYHDYLANIKDNEINNLINKAIHLIKEQNFNYKYIIVDEAMNLTTNNYNFIKELINHCNASYTLIGKVEECIYQTNGSNPKYLLDDNVRKISLEQNSEIKDEIIYSIDETLNTLPENSTVLLAIRYPENIKLLNENYEINSQNIIYKNRKDLNIKLISARRCKEEQADYVVIIKDSNKLLEAPIISQIMGIELDLERLLYYNVCLTASKNVYLYEHKASN